MAVGMYGKCDNCGTMEELPNWARIDLRRPVAPAGWYIVTQPKSDSFDDDSHLFCGRMCVAEAASGWSGIGRLVETGAPALKWQGAKL